MAGIVDEARRIQWFALRSTLFKSVTLPSVSNQTVRPDRWYLLLSSGDEYLYASHLSLKESWIKAVYLKEGADLQVTIRSLLLDDFAAAPELVLSRADNDDALQRNFYLKVAERVDGLRRDRECSILSRYGCRWDGVQLQVVDYPNNPFISLFMPDWKASKTDFFGIPHTEILRRPHAFTRGDAASPMWLQTLHGANASNRILERFALAPANVQSIIKDFGVGAEASQAILEHRRQWEARSTGVHPGPLNATGKDDKAPVDKLGDTSSGPAELLNFLVELLGAKSYLEVGVGSGYSHDSIEAPRKVTVDSHSTTRSRGGAMVFDGSSEEYFRGICAKDRFDVVFIDDRHTFEQTHSDFQASLLASHRESIIVLSTEMPALRRDDKRGVVRSAHLRTDCRQARREQRPADTYKLVAWIHDFMPLLEFKTVAIGSRYYTLVWRAPRADWKPVFADAEAISRLSYFDIDEVRSVMRVDSLDRVKCSLRERYMQRVPGRTYPCDRDSSFDPGAAGAAQAT